MSTSRPLGEHEARRVDEIMDSIATMRKRKTGTILQVFSVDRLVAEDIMSMANRPVTIINVHYPGHLNLEIRSTAHPVRLTHGDDP